MLIHRYLVVNHSLNLMSFHGLFALAKFNSFESMQCSMNVCLWLRFCIHVLFHDRFSVDLFFIFLLVSIRLVGSYFIRNNAIIKQLLSFLL